jgi:drug/metabolite transporter (DMT)-like permease
MSSLISVLEPLANPIWVFLVVGEVLSLYSIAGSAVVLVTITVWCIWGEKQKQKQALTEQEMIQTAE